MGGNEGVVEPSAPTDGVPSIRCAFVGDEALVAQCVQIAQSYGLVPVLLATTSPIARDFGIEQGIPVVGHGEELSAGLDLHPADVLFSIANLRVIPDDVLARVTTAINYHDGPLPGYAGLNVSTWALLNGERQHAITWHLMTADVDGGEVVATERFPITDDETAFSLNARCYEAALATFPRIAAALAAGQLHTEPQPAGEHRMFGRHDRPARLLDPATPARASVRDVRALDLGHWLRNSIGSVRLVLGDDVYLIVTATEVGDPSGAAAGTLLSLDGDGARVATVDGDLLVTEISTADGAPADLTDIINAHGIDVGAIIPSPPAALVDAIAEIEPALSRDELFWIDRLATTAPAQPLLETAVGSARATGSIDTPDGADEAAVLATIALWLARTTGSVAVSFAVTDQQSRNTLERTAPLTRPGVACIEVAAESTFADLRQVALAEIEVLRRRQPLLHDAVARDPRTRGHGTGVGRTSVPVVVELDDITGADRASDPVAPATLRIAVGEHSVVIDAPSDPTDPDATARLAEQLITLLRAGLADPSSRAIELPMLGPSELASLEAVNQTDLDYDRIATIDALFRAQAVRTPDGPALSSGDRTLSYAELENAARALAGRLAAAGVGRGDCVGIAVPRGVDMVLGVLATLELGAAYLPLDPTYPMERLGFMVDDAGIAVLLSTGGTAAELGRPGITVIDPSIPGLEATGPRAAGGAPTDRDVRVRDAAAHDGAGHGATDLAYLIYTSGSTGLPKGVMLEHRQVTNFFEAMDQVIDRDPQGVWLAVTSLSFDISVLELLWTLTRGFHVVLKSDSGVHLGSGGGGGAAPVRAAEALRPVTFSLFYFAAGEDAASDGYRLLLDSARFADRNGFEAVWTPERHFHAFGGAYPNPSVTGAALAAITEHVSIRAGSVVLPLHSPIRVAEEWAVVDNISRGRVAISFAPGWQPNDFVLNPSSYATAKEDLPRNIELVQRLWRGETVSMPGHDGAPVDVRTLPRPVQAELPVWLTSAGTPATFERAGTLGVNVLTHLLGQSVEQLAENIAGYRAAWSAAGHQGEGHVTLMMHTYLDQDAETAREVAREPMKGYLSTAVGLLRDVASAFPTFANRGKGTDDLFTSLSADELDQLLEMAAQRYLGTSGLFGTPDEAATIVETVSAAGVDEVACLVDFGVATDDVLASLELLLEAKAQVDDRRAARSDALGVTTPVPVDHVADTVAALTTRYGVTHLQCTPSLAAMLAADPADRAALATISHLMVGGEALPAALATELRALLPGRFTNMYGPTETTIWSLTHALDQAPGASIPIGTPVANTTIFVLDADGRRLPLGVYGELHIGGEGVARGYHNRPELTAERFVERPGLGRVYATGDVVRIHPAGYVEFAGRADNQVKIRGHRIELGEIESVIDRHPDVVQSVVVARDDRGDIRLLAYVVMPHGTDATADAVRKHVGETLPDAMVPSAVVRLDAFPLTPNGKVDRNALAAGDIEVRTRAEAVMAPPIDDTEKLVADIWSDELGFPVGRDDNFFDIGGHSLLAVKVFRRLVEATAAPLALTDVFRFPTVRTFAAHLGARTGSPAADEPAAAVGGPTGVDRGAMRRRARSRRGNGADQGDAG